MSMFAGSMSGHPEGRTRSYQGYPPVRTTRRPPAAGKAGTERRSKSGAVSLRRGAMQEPSPEETGADRFAETPTAGAPRVLVVDAAIGSAAALAAELEAAGMAVVTETDGDRALERLRALGPDLIVMDVALPGMNGFDLAARLQNEPALNHVPVIFRTDVMETENILRGLEVGGIDYIAKARPVSEIVARIRTHLRVAHMSHTMRLALDASHRPTIGVRSDGSLLWYTPAAASLLSAIFVSWRPNDPLPAALRNVLSELLQKSPVGGRKTVVLGAEEGNTGEGGNLECITAGLTADGAMGVTLLFRRPGEEERRLAARHNLTTREAQVLFWVGRGKPNRDISEILGISARTVNKHLEQIFSKLGIENRASAAAIAVKTSNE